MASTLRAAIFTGATPTAASAEGGIKFNREDSASGTTAIPIPTSTGTKHSFHKNLGLEVTSDDNTAISNKRIHYDGSLPAGVKLWWMASGSYVQAALADSDAGTDDTGPSGYTAMTSSPVQYDAGPDDSNVGLNGDYVRVALSVDSTYNGGAGSAIALPDIILTYDEA